MLMCAADTCHLLHLAQVLLNGSRLPVKAFQDYVELYVGPKDNGVPRIYEKVNDRWEIVISTTEGQFNQVSTAPGLHGWCLRCSCLALLLWAIEPGQ
jgi:hypothetical protein